MGLSKAKQKEVDEIKELMKSNENFLKFTDLLIFTRQTQTEQATKATYDKNDIGFNKADAYPLTDAAIWILNDLEFTDDDREFVNKRMEKYANQLSGCEEIQAILKDNKTIDTYLQFFRDEIRDDIETIPTQSSLKEFIDANKARRKKEAYERRKAKLKKEREEERKKKREEYERIRALREAEWEVRRLERLEKEKTEKEIRDQAVKEYNKQSKDHTEISGTFKRETEKAVLLNVQGKHGRYDLWTPKSLVKDFNKDSETHKIINWFLAKKGLGKTLNDFINEKLAEVEVSF